MNKIMLLSVLLSMFFLSCSDNDIDDGIVQIETEKIEKLSKKNKNSEDISFNVLENYFLYKDLDVNEFHNQETFFEYFGQAAHMGNLPTIINWGSPNREFVITVDEPETFYKTTVVPISLTKNSDDQLTFTYKVVKGELRTSSIKPFIAISVDFEHYPFFEDIILNKKN